MNLEIIALGDGAYVRAVLDAAAGVTNYGMLGAIGMMIGLILMGVKGVTAQGGPRFDPAWFIVSVVIFWVMFMIRVDRVVVSEVMVQPGNVAPRSFVVDNVPFGLAGAGYIVSNLASKITMQYETSFGSATDESRGTTGGLGRNLMMLAQLKTVLNNPNFTDTGVGPNSVGYIGKYRENMGSYLMNCTFPLVNQGVLSRNAVMTSPGISGAVNDITANALRTMRWRDTSSYRTRTCRDAKTDIEKATQDPELLEAFDKAMKENGKDSSAADIQRAFGTWANLSGQQMQTMIATTIMNAVMAEAAQRGSLSPAEAQSIIMVEEASQRRNAQWAGEENLFIRMLRPIVSFFEAFYYALAPIMAVVCCMGQFGWSMIGKYMALTVWVGLWFPMLAITQLYSNTQMAYFFERLGDSGADYTPMQLNQIAFQAMDTLGAASALTAATPALAMSLLFGGAVSMSYLAGRLQGSDMIDENKVAPQASKVDAIASQGGAMEGNANIGQVASGAGMPKLSVGQTAESSRRASESYNAQQTQSFSDSLERMVAESKGTAISGSHIENSGSMTSFADKIGESLRSSAGTDATARAAYDKWKDMSQAEQNQFAAAGYVGMKGSLTASAKIGTPGEGIIGSGASTTASASAETGAEARWTQTKTNGASEGWKEGDAVAAGISQALSKDKSLAAEGAVALSSAIQDGVQTNSVHGITASEASKLSTTAQEVFSSARAYESANAMSERIGLSEDIPMNVAVQNFKSTSANAEADVNRMIAEINHMGGGKELAEIHDSLGNTGLANLDTDRKIAAVGTWLAGNGHVAAGMEDDRSALTSQFLSKATATGGMVGGASSAPAAVSHGATVQQEVSSHVPGAGSIVNQTSDIAQGLPSFHGTSAGADNGIAAAEAATNAGHSNAQGHVDGMGSRDRQAFDNEERAKVNQVHHDTRQALEDKK